MPFDRVLFMVNDAASDCEGYATSPANHYLQEQGFTKRIVLSPEFSDSKVNANIPLLKPCYNLMYSFKSFFLCTDFEDAIGR